MEKNELNLNVTADITRFDLAFALEVYGLDDLAEQVKNRDNYIAICDLCHFSITDEEGVGEEYSIAGYDDFTEVRSRLLTPGTTWEYQDEPDYTVPLPDRARVIEAVEATLNLEGKEGTGVPAEYWKKTVEQRLASGTGSVYQYFTKRNQLEAALLKADWKRASHPNVAPGCEAYVTEDIAGGLYGMVPLADLPETTTLIIEDQKGTGKVSLVVEGGARIPAAETWCIVGSADNGQKVIYTFHPGEPIPRATTGTEELPVGTRLTKQEAMSLGFNLAKVR